MMIDCHTHIRCRGREIELSDHLTAAQTVEHCLVLASADTPNAVSQVNAELSAYVRKHKTKMTGFAVVDPTQRPADRNYLRNLLDMGLKGAVLYCSEGGFHPAHTSAMRFYEAAQELGMPVFFHNGGHFSSKAVLDYAQPYLLDEVARTFGDLKIVIGSMGMPFLEQTLCMAGKHANVYADLSISPSRVWRIYNTIIAAFEVDVMDKLIFGSGFPLGNAGECIETLLGFNKLLGDINLPRVPRGVIRSVLERDTLQVLGLEGQTSRAGQKAG